MQSKHIPQNVSTKYLAASLAAKVATLGKLLYQKVHSNMKVTLKSPYQLAGCATMHDANMHHRNYLTLL